MTPAFTEPLGWLVLKDELASILEGETPLYERFNAIIRQLESLGWPHYAGLQLELDSMRRSAEENREAPFVHVGQDLLAWCDQKYRGQIEADHARRGERGRPVPQEAIDACMRDIRYMRKTQSTEEWKRFVEGLRYKPGEEELARIRKIQETLAKPSSYE